MLINARAHRGRRPLDAAPLLIVAGATAGVALAGHARLLGAFGGEVDQAGDFVLLSALSFASGLQNAAVATSTGLLVRTTHLTRARHGPGHPPLWNCSTWRVRHGSRRGAPG